MKCGVCRVAGLLAVACEVTTPQKCVFNISGVKKISTDLLREGAPIEPDPPVSHWKPEAVVTCYLKFCWVFFLIYLLCFGGFNTLHLDCSKNLLCLS